MTMSLHLVEHRVRDVPHRWRHRRCLQAEVERTPGVAVARLMPNVDLRASTGGLPRPRCAALLVGWDHRAARDAWFADPTWPASYTQDAGESWAVALDSVRVTRGDWHGWRPERDGAERLQGDEPLAVLTLGFLRPRSVPAFVQGNRRVLRDLDDNPDETFRLGLMDGPLGFGTFTLWRSRAAMGRFAYGTGAHAPVRRRFDEEDRIDHPFFVRFRPVAAHGTWRGRDPLAEVRAATPAAGSARLSAADISVVTVPRA
ncbi:hypothetical protein RB608_27325 [Nocardioides sp. LHD-245]|uniref:hypothetical protein n=1 Tax=Nocardioides sp. LHD-245 TaxID=3051387 RepID=UPI0027E0B549|nr:hypothetical protein [Nocardioides sp. LHD-245]